MISSKTAHIMEKSSISAKKSLGQNFISDSELLSSIIATSSVTSDDIIVEIGPGTGALTRELLHTGANVLAIEKDDRLIPILRETFSNELSENQLTLLHEDALSFDSSTIKKPYKIVANIPYYITGALLRLLFSGENLPTSITLMVQKEVAERIVASNGKESVLSLSIKSYGKPEYIQTVSKEFFDPIPKVDSAILHISNISHDFFVDCPEKGFFSLVKRGFASKRRTLLNNLWPKDKSTGTELLISLNLDSRIRAEKLSLLDWKELLTVMGSEPNISL